ncbi:MBL fold metallo-hydrolase [Citricoccus sp. SGAir0253]|uniref:MBL fold metallo-hydrolase n=1 Tax=Citricoccus sp. SGAir0253 TaxID=2567881 RepID=UPI0010CCE5CE|nr:MBL fold metallo-hydrolase [Citricoccus sp. SGAir0253]QCU77228.1 MBL fold metallo-hydrolase [Citricoccus sp. SGAir0253]
MASPAPDTHLTAAVLARNPSGMTLEGTNTYLVGDPAADSVVVVDPGPAEGAEEHLAAVLEAAGRRRVELILVTHHHEDHTGAVELFAGRTGAPVRGGSPAWSRGAAPLAPGERIPAAGVVVTAWHTPGHTSDSYSFALPDDGAAGSVLTGDTVLGRGTTMIDHPDGTLADYLRSLELLISLGDATVLPAHGPALASIAEVGRQYREHRHARLEQVRGLVATLGPADLEVLRRGPGRDPATAVSGEQPAAFCALAERLAATVYPEVTGRVRSVAAMTMAAHLAYLAPETGAAGS